MQYFKSTVFVNDFLIANRWDEKVLKQKNGHTKKSGVSDGAAKANAKQFNDDVKDDAAAAVISEANKFLQIQETKGKKDQGKAYFIKIFSVLKGSSR